VVFYGIGCLVFAKMDLRSAWVKYVVIFWVFAITTTITTALTFHAYLVMLLPIVYCSMYSSKRVMVYAYILTVVNIVITVYVGYSYGLCDCNMALLSGKPLTEYLDEAGNFTLTQVNDRTWWTLPLFFVLPRSVICLGFAVICSTVSTIIRDNMKYMQEMETMAELDEMTGVFNRNKYLSMTTESYAHEDTVAVIFWDINGLKKTNDALGHSAGDELIVSIADAIKNVSNQFDNAYRIGGDEFVMIMRGGTEYSAKKKIQEWEGELQKIQKNTKIRLSASSGFAAGPGHELDRIIKQADEMMYENKHHFYENSEK
jgi:diguanylate cyclase (GGDEF)-like protein